MVLGILLVVAILALVLYLTRHKWYPLVHREAFNQPGVYFWDKCGWGGKVTRIPEGTYTDEQVARQLGINSDWRSWSQTSGVDGSIKVDSGWSVTHQTAPNGNRRTVTVTRTGGAKGWQNRCYTLVGKPR